MSVDRLPVTVIYGRLCAVTLAVVRVFVRPQKQFINKLDPGPTVSGLLSRNQRVRAHRNRLCERHLKKFINGVSAGTSILRKGSRDTRGVSGGVSVFV